jgi:hypothetical protein
MKMLLRSNTALGGFWFLNMYKYTKDQKSITASENGDSSVPWLYFPCKDK